MDATITAAIIGAIAVIIAALVPILKGRNPKREQKPTIDKVGITESKPEIGQFLASGQRVVCLFEQLEGMTEHGLHKDWSSEERDKFAKTQRMAAEEFGRVDGILDKYGQRKRVWGEEKQEVDIFREALSISPPGRGRGIFRHAIQEMNIVMAKLRDKANEPTQVRPTEGTRTP